MADIIRLWGAVDYNPDLAFFEKMYKVAKDLSKDFKHWSTDRLSVGLNDFERHECLTLTSRRIAFEALNPADVVKTIEKLGEKVQWSLSELTRNNISRMGLKMIVYSDLGLSFDELRQQLRPICIPQNERMGKITSSEILDFQVAHEYKWQNNNALLRISPMKREHGLINIQGIGEINRLFPPPDTSDALSKFLLGLPETFLGFDLDVFLKEDRNPQEWPTFFRNVAPYLISVHQEVKNMVLECSK